ncbi:MAG: hypothetical protein ACYC9U_09850 [Nitrososphaerales archaeon]
MKEERCTLSPEELTPEAHGAVLCYPGTDLSSFNSRIDQLKEIGVREIILEGSSKVGKYGIIGKGCVSIVVKARIGGEVIALKIRRVDANRDDTSRDYELQRVANSFGVGPKAIAASRDFFAMEYINSLKIGRWFAGLKTRSPKKQVRTLVRDMLQQCYLLDIHGLDHGELSNPSKHILIRNGSQKAVIIDYESASTARKPSNLTAVAAFLFLGSQQSEKLRKILAPAGKQLSRKKLISLFGEYKRDCGEASLEKIFAYLRV